MRPETKRVLATIRGERQDRPPIWIMRQAGRYLPEYRAVRASVGGFLELCYTPAKAAEVTLQPLKRFDLDAAILFSDILVIPDALGQKVRFEAGEGPLLEPITPQGLGKLRPEAVLEHLSPVFETLERIKDGLAIDKSKTLLGFCGSPWTVATYMIGGRGTADQAPARSFALAHPAAMKQLLDILVEASAVYLIAQFRAGADAVQLFESWASNLDEKQFSELVIGPNRRIVDKVRAAIPDAPIIGFPRGAAGQLPSFAAGTGVNAVGLDHMMPLSMATWLRRGFPVQGNLDPMRLVAGGAEMEARVEEIIAAFADRPHIFNLGHGIVPETPIAHVEHLVEIVKRRR